MSPLHPHRRARVAPALAALALLALAACSDGPGEPADPLVVTATLANTAGPQIVDATPTTPTLVRCGVTVRLNANGTGRSRFGELTIYRFTGTDRARPTDSTRISAALVQQAFAASAIVPNVSLSAAWTVDDSVPFTSRFVIRHRVEGSSADEQLTVDAPCGAGAATSTAGPAIGDISAFQSAPDLEPGDTLVVRFDVTAPFGLWRTSARITGPCEVSGASTQRLQTSLRAEFTFVLPVTCALGVPLRLQVTAADAALRADTTELTTGLQLVDNAAPVVQGTMDMSFMASPTFFGGDSLTMLIFARDNVYPRWITVRGTSSTREDSIPVSPTDGYGQQYRFAARNEWAGSTTLTLRAIDAAGNVGAPFQTFTPNTGYQFHASTSRASTGVTIAGEVNQLVVDRQGRAHVMQFSESRIVTLARGTLATVATTALAGGRPVAIAATPSGDSIVVLQAGQRTFRWLDVRGATPVLGPEIALQGLDAGKGELPSGALVVTARNTAFLVVTATQPADWRIVEVNLATGATITRDAAASGASLTTARLLRSGDGRTVLASTTTYSGPNTTNCVRRWTLDSDTFTPCVDLVEHAVTAIDRTGATIVSNRRVFDATLTASRAMPLFDRIGTRPTTVSPDGATVYATYREGLIRIRASDGATLDLLRGTASLDGFGLDVVTLSPDGTVAVMHSSAGSSGSRIVTMALP